MFFTAVVMVMLFLAGAYIGAPILGLGLAGGVLAIYSYSRWAFRSR